MEEPICYLGDPTTTREEKITKMLWYFQRKYLSEVKPYPTYQRNPLNKMKE